VETVFLIAGPTASGKSALALDLARRVGGVIVNADSMQVYADLRVITARPTEAEEALAPHRLYGHVDGAANYSVGRYLADAGAQVAELRARGRPPIVVGGTGLYFKALLEGLSVVPAVPDEVRAAVRARSEGRSTPALHAELAAVDPDGAARLQPQDRLRILRALEVWETTGRPLASFQEERSPAPLAGLPTVRLFLAPDRAALKRRIDARFGAMLAAGALDEVRALAARGLDPALPIMRAHGVPGLLAYLSGEIALDEAVARGQADTRSYAKRQFTWFRHQMPGWRWLDPDEARADLLGAIAEKRCV
jgi:tRNA dimethylallyltransferase